MVVYMLGTEVFRVFPAVELIEMLTCIDELLRTGCEHGIVGDVYDAFKGRHLVGFDNRCHDIAHEEQFGFGMVYDVVNLLGIEFVLDGDGHGSVGKRCQESCCPEGTVATAKCYFVSLPHSAVFKQNVEFFYFSSHILILERGALIVGEGIQIPVLYD